MSPLRHGRTDFSNPARVALTAREREVAALITHGLTNAQIAENLVITPGTAANHVANILGRLGLRTRTQIAVWAVHMGVADVLEFDHSG